MLHRLDTQLATTSTITVQYKPCLGEGTINFSNNDSQELKTLLLDKDKGDPYSFTPMLT